MMALTNWQAKDRFVFAPIEDICGPVYWRCSMEISGTLKCEGSGEREKT